MILIALYLFYSFTFFLCCDRDNIKEKVKKRGEKYIEKEDYHIAESISADCCVQDHSLANAAHFDIRQSI